MQAQAKISSAQGRQATDRVRPLPRGVHAKLKLGGAHDEAEKQADRIAAKALSKSSPSASQSLIAAQDARSSIRRALAPVEGSEQLSAPVEEEQALPENLEREILSLQSGGQPLPPPLRSDMEARFGLDLSTVRIHTDPNAAELNETLHAHAFSVGEHIAFNAGRYQPESSEGRFLLAHELAHVAQQRGEAGQVESTPVRRGFLGGLYDAATSTLGDIADWAADQLASVGWQIIEAISPEFARTLRAIQSEGILAWLGRQVARAWDAYIATLRALVPFDGPRQLIDLFAGLVERAARIAAALASGDCQPLMAAIGELKTFVTETVGVAWNKLTEFLQPVGQFFSDLWTNFGAPAVQWLQDFGGEVWQWVQDLGRSLWDWIAPLRDAASRIWNWFSELLFGASDDAAGGSQGGVIGWITSKAGEAWDWVKERTRPVWQPVVEFAGKVSELIPPAFVRQMGESYQTLSTQLDTAAAGMDGGEGVPQSRDSLASVLPSVEAILATVRGLIVGAGQWLSERITAIGGLVSSLISGLRGSDLLSWLASAFNWLAEAVESLASWARDQVTVLFDWLVRGFDALTPFLQMVLETVRKVISIYGDLLQLPLLILNAIWQKVPACIREPVEKFIKEQVLSRIPVFGQFFSDPELWPRVQQTALDILRRIFVDGDLPGAAWAFFKAVLAILGIPARLVVQILAKASRAIGEILSNPIGFLINTLRAMRAGFGLFFDKIGGHLLHGVTGWLLGQLCEAGIKPPQDFSLRSIFSFLLDTLGITADKIFKRLAEKVGQDVVDKIRKVLSLASGVWQFVKVLVNEGPAGLVRELQERLSGLWDTALQGIIGWVTETIIQRVTVKLLSMLDPSGIMAVINAMIAIYKAIESFVKYLVEMLRIISTVLDGVIDLAHGAIDTAAAYLETALGSAMPIAIGFLANQLGLGKLSANLREMLVKAREAIDKAIDWLIDRALQAGRALLDMAKRGVASLSNWWKQRFAFKSASGESHSLYVNSENPDAELMVASKPMSYRAFLDGIPETKANKSDKEKASKLYAEFITLQRLASKERRSGTASTTKKGDSDTHSASLVDRIQKLAEATAALMPADPKRSTAPSFGTVTAQGYGRRVQIEKLTSERGHWPIRGGEPSVRSPRWNRLSLRATDGNTSDYLYIRGHLLNHNLDGPGNLWENLTPLTQTANNRGSDSMLHSFENKVKQTIEETSSKGGFGQVANFDVQANYATNSRSNDLKAIDKELAKTKPTRPASELNKIRDIVSEEQFLPTSISCSAELIHADGKREKLNKPVNNVITNSWEKYTLVNR